MAISSICDRTLKINRVKTSLKYTVITPHLRQNDRNRAFGMLVAGTSVNALQACFITLVLRFITSYDGTIRQEKNYRRTLAGTT